MYSPRLWEKTHPGLKIFQETFPLSCQTQVRKGRDDQTWCCSSWSTCSLTTTCTTLNYSLLGILVQSDTFLSAATLQLVLNYGEKERVPLMESIFHSSFVFSRGSAKAEIGLQSLPAFESRIPTEVVIPPLASKLLQHIYSYKARHMVGWAQNSRRGAIGDGGGEGIGAHG